MEEHKALGRVSEQVSEDKMVQEMDYYTLMLDRDRHKSDLNSFFVETMHKIDPATNSNSDIFANSVLWLAPNHRLLDLEVVEPDDLLVLGTREQFEAASKF